MPNERDLQRNDTRMLVLAVLSAGPNHGYAIARDIENRSAHALSMGEGALYPALRALENEKLVTAAWELQPVGAARKVYTLTDLGRKELDLRTDAWLEYTRAVSSMIGGKLNEQPA